MPVRGLEIQEPRLSADMTGGNTPPRIDGSAAFLARRESAEALPLHGQEVFMTGGSQGTGKKVLFDLVGLGAHVTATSRYPEKIRKIVTEVKTAQEKGEISSEVDVEKQITPLQVDFQNKWSVKRAVQELATTHDGKRFKAEVNVQAGGMEAYSRRLMEMMINLQKIKKEQGDKAFIEARDRMQRDLAKWVIDAMPVAMCVNYFGPTLMLDGLIEAGVFYEDAKYVNFASVWTDAEVVDPELQKEQGRPEIPLWYRTVSTSKKLHDSEIHSDEGRTHLEAYGVYPFTVVGQVIEDTLVGKMVNKFILPLLSEENRRRYQESNKPMTTADMSKAVQIMLLSDPNDPELWTPGQPRKLYVLGPTGTDEEARENIVRELPRSHPMLTFKSPI